MAGKTWNQGQFIPKNPNKYIGKMPITYRSAWELAFMNVLDTHPNVSQWASESIEIQYKNPLTGQISNYIPDFLVIYTDKYGKKHGEIIEIKPLKESSMEHAKSKRDRAVLAVNTAKWQAAIVWAKKRGLDFRVMTEQSLFAQKGKRSDK